jgi:phosphoserine phosphatase
MSFDVICFDCDSTLSKIEGIDELAKQAGVGEAMVKLTDAAMNGEVPLEAVYAQRLDIIRPNQASMLWVADLYISEIVPGVVEVFNTLHTQGKQVHIISGGIRQAILPLAEKLGVPKLNVHAVNVFFDADGQYLDFDRNSPLAKTGGKAIVVAGLNAGANCVMIGDGKTDMEAKQAGAFTIGFGGVVERAVVKELADAYCADASLLSVLAYIAKQ